MQILIRCDFDVHLTIDSGCQTVETKTICDLPDVIRFAFEEGVRTRFLDKDDEIRLSRRDVGVAGKVSRTRGRVKLIVISSCRGLGGYS